ncbi:MAG: RHS repeat-associated core domain-containing protein [Candidatus Riflebacteria bacterium]|nr:RHS repeat-associated core domain-containing protein [Candidatus Riflebacteria bacterium]
MAGRLIATIDPLGKRSIFSYDNRNRVIGISDPEGRVVSYGYDPAGRRVSLSDGVTRCWRWEYDVLDQVIAQIDPNGDIDKFSYDPLGNCITKLNARGQSLPYEYDVMNRLKTVRYPDVTAATFSYDLSGRETFRSCKTGWIKRTWNPLGELLSQSFGPYEKTWKYQYDLAGNRNKAISPENGTFQYEYDRGNHLTKPSPPGTLGDITYSYDLADHLINVTRPGVVSKFSYDKAGKLIELRHERQTDKNKLLALRKYTYNAADNPISILDEDNGTTSYEYDNSSWLTGVTYPDKQKCTFAYNGAGDRIRETIGKSVVDYAYDPAGRMLSRGKDTYKYDADGNLTESVEDGLETDYTWSPENQLLKVAREVPCKKHFLFHCSKCPKTVDITEENSYYPEDWRLMIRKSAGQAFFSAYDDADESHEYVITPQPLAKDWHFGPLCWKAKQPPLLPFREFISSPGTDDIEMTRYHSRNFSMLKDGLGSTIALVNRGGNIISKINYDVWGNFRWPDKKGYGVPPCKEDDLCDVHDRLEGRFTFGDADHDYWHYGKYFGKTLTPYLYAGRRINPVTAFYFNRNRFYSSSIGRFISKDPIGFGGGANLWAYARNNPVAYSDPNGFDLMSNLSAFNKATSININALNNATTINFGALNKTTTINTGAFNTAVKMNVGAFNLTTDMDVDAFNRTMAVYKGAGQYPFHDVMYAGSPFFEGMGGSIQSLFDTLDSSPDPTSPLQSYFSGCPIDPSTMYVQASEMDVIITSSTEVAACNPYLLLLLGIVMSSKDYIAETSSDFGQKYDTYMSIIEALAGGSSSPNPEDPDKNKDQGGKDPR